MQPAYEADHVVYRVEILRQHFAGLDLDTEFAFEKKNDLQHAGGIDNASFQQ
jgi:hypothetical protein